LSDFLTRVDLRKVNKKTVESLIKAGAFVQFASRATHITFYPQLVKEIAERKTEADKGQFGLFSDANENLHVPDDFEAIPELTEDEVYAMEKEVVGFLINKNPLTKYMEIREKKATKKIGEVNVDDIGQTVVLLGIISSKKIITTKKKNEEMAFLTLYDETGSIEVVVFPTLFRKLAASLGMNHVLIFKGKITQRDDALSLIMDIGMKLG
jgi:DNA polymerase-3 subunit alpha